METKRNKRFIREDNLIKYSADKRVVEADGRHVYVMDVNGEAIKMSPRTYEVMRFCEKYTETNVMFPKLIQMSVGVGGFVKSGKHGPHEHIKRLKEWGVIRTGADGHYSWTGLVNAPISTRRCVQRVFDAAVVLEDEKRLRVVELITEVAEILFGEGTSLCEDNDEE